jgi:hypothetical protein
MGKHITLYLTATELDMIEKICAKDGVVSNMSSTLKQGLATMFKNCFSLGGPTHGPGHEPRFATKEFIIEETRADFLAMTDEDLAKEGFKRWKCPKCGRIEPYLMPLDTNLRIASPSEKKLILKKEPEKRLILKKISEKDKKELERLGVSTE